VPYIYSQDELRALLAAAARRPPAGALRGPTYQTLLGLLYSTGLRISEAMALNLADCHRDDARLLSPWELQSANTRGCGLEPSTSNSIFVRFHGNLAGKREKLTQ